MPPYLTHKANTYYYRQGVPVELRSILGKREIKKSLGHDYHRAVRECKRMAVEADNLLADARTRLDNLGTYTPMKLTLCARFLSSAVTARLMDKLPNY